jgi:hypothetical protein
VLTERQIATLAAVADTMFPPGSADDPGEPGGAALGAHEYIARALRGPYAAHATRYREALDGLDAEGDGDFAGLDEPGRVALLKAFEAGEQGFDAGFFPVLRAHVMEGVWCNPEHGGNRNGQGWAIVGYPGAQLSHTVEELTLGSPASLSTLHSPLRTEV